MTGIQVRGLRKFFVPEGTAVHAVADLNFDVAAGEMLVLLGPSGCGKTTTLRCVAGLEEPNEGEIVIDGSVVFSDKRGISVPPERRQVGMVFQSYAVWPHMTVFQNVAYPLEERGERVREVENRVMDMLAVVGLQAFGRRYPHELSGGQQQRVALARALVTHPRAVLFDEPLSNLDARLRDQMRFEIIDIQSRFRFTGLYVTHDQVEAMSMGTRIAVMSGGVFEQVGPPRDVYNNSRTAFVAEFLGATNLLPAELVSASDARLNYRCGALPEVVAGASRAADEIPNPARIGIRMEEVELLPIESKPAMVNTWPGTVVHRIFLGDSIIYTVEIAGMRIKARTRSGSEFAPGAPVLVHFPPGCVVAYAG